MTTAAPLQAATAKPASLASPGLLLQRKCACGASNSSIGDKCEECQSKTLQRKLAIGSSSDPLELEADRVADQVMQSRGHDSVGTVRPRIQRFSGQPGGELGSAPASVDRVLASSGRPLEPTLRNDMEQRFGYDFSRVRVHSGADAELSAREVSARAYTVGSDVVFGAGGFAPGNCEGRRLIAHELTHVVQQSDSERRNDDRFPVPRRRGHDSIAILSAIDNSQAGRWLQRDTDRTVTLYLEVPTVLTGSIGSPSRGGQLYFSVELVQLPSNLVKYGRSRSALTAECVGGIEAALRTLGGLERLPSEPAKLNIRVDVDYPTAQKEGQVERLVRRAARNKLKPLIAQEKSDRALKQSANLVASGLLEAASAIQALAQPFMSLAEHPQKKQTPADFQPGPQSPSGGKRCKFFVYDSTEDHMIGKAWKYGANAEANLRSEAYSIPSGESTEEMLERILNVYATKDCDCTAEIQFWSHGSSGLAMWVSSGTGSNRELTMKDFDIPGLAQFGDGPVSMPGYREWSSGLSTRQRRLVLLRRTICDTDSEIYYRSCQAFQGKGGQDFAVASVNFWRATVLGHTKLIGVTQPGKKTLKPRQEPDWSELEGKDEEGKKGKDKLHDVKPR